jgi:hypothetical protein
VERAVVLRWSLVSLGVAVASGLLLGVWLRLDKGLGCAAAALWHPADPLAAKKEAWRQTLEGMPFRFSEHHAGAQYSLSQNGGDCKVHVINDPNGWGRLTFQFERDGKEILALNGHTGSVFRTANDVLYFAHFKDSSSGCTVAAYDLTAGKKLWQTKLNAVDLTAHSAYSNRVTMALSGGHGPDEEGEGAVLITGQESFGDYVEVLDRASGAVLAHRVYRQGFGRGR